MKVYHVAAAASALSGLALIGCLAAMWSITADVRSLRRQLDGEMVEFKVSGGLVREK